MNLFRTELQFLFWKEVRQLTRNQGAMLSGLFLPAVLVVLAPVLALLASRSPGEKQIVVSAVSTGLTGLHELHGVQDFFLFVTLPVLFVLAGVLTPTLMASYTVISEREQHSLELLLALPVSIGDILIAKLAANMVIGSATMVPMFVVDSVVITSLSREGLAYVIGSLLLLVSALVASIGTCLLMALLARDFRTSHYYGGGLAVPPLLLTALGVVFVPGVGRFFVLAPLMLALGCFTFYAGLRWLTLERFLS